MTRVLRHGYTTGACAAAAAKGSALMLAHQTPLHEITITLPTGMPATFKLLGQSFTPDSASCFVIKDAGDDPDITNGAEIHAAVKIMPGAAQETGRITVEGGTGIGRITKPGLAVPPGEWAINPVPRRMICDAVGGSVPGRNLLVTVSIPDGEIRSLKTLNSRLGIMGGLSILGTTGIVRPVSAQAWTDTIEAACDVAKACNCENVVLSTGRSSEMAVQNFINRQGTGDRGQGSLFSSPCTLPSVACILPDEAYIMMGDHIASSLRACLKRGFDQPVIACQFAKLLKIACGHENTHAAASVLDLRLLLEWAQQEELPEALTECIAKAHTAREIALASSFNPRLLEMVFKRAESATQRHAPGISPRFMVADFSGNCVSISR